MSNNHRSYSPDTTYIGIGDDMEKFQNQLPSAINTPPPPKPSK